MAPQILDVLKARFYNSRASMGFRYPKFVNYITGETLSITATVIWAALKQWESGELDKRAHMGTLGSFGMYARCLSNSVANLFLYLATYMLFLETWRKKKPTSQAQILETIRQELADSLQQLGGDPKNGDGPVVHIESDNEEDLLQEMVDEKRLRTS
jgi:hypothetical protein